MKNKFLPFILIIFFAVVFGYSYFSPLLQDKQLLAHDQLTASGGAKEIQSYYQETSKVSHWTNSMFGGMPAYTIWGKSNFNPILSIKGVIQHYGQHPASTLILIILGAFLCLILFGISPWISIIGALLYGFASHYFILAGAGHVTKLWALAYMAPLIGSIFYTYNKKTLLGVVLTALFLSFEVGSSHPQITYYILIAILLFEIAGLFFAIRKKETTKFLSKSFLLIIAVLFAVGVNSRYLITTQEYAKYSTRGQNELTVDNNSGESGLSKDYILDYSYDVSEALTAFIPRLKGGGMSEPLGSNSNLYSELEKIQGKAQAEKFVKNVPLYWGSQPIVSGPFYFGAITIFLFVFGLFVVKGKEKWWLAAVVVVSFLFSLGKYFPSLSNFAIDYLPLYNKFRDVKNIVFIQAFAMWLLGMLAIKEIFQDKKLESKLYLNSLKYATIIAGGIALIIAVVPSIAGSFTGSVDAQLASSGWPKQLLSALHSDRIAVARSDAFRSLVFVLLAAGLIWAVLKNKLKANYALVIAGVLVLADLWPVNKRYLNDDDFVAKRQAETPFTASNADLEILKDNSLDYRVFNISVNPWSDASTSYFHKSIGGYSGAKIGRYQDMIEHHLGAEQQQLIARLQNIKSQADVEKVFVGLNSLNMLNAKYIIYNPKASPLLNGNALGNAWFVNNYVKVANANEEIDRIGEINVAQTAIIDQQFASLLPSQITNDSLKDIQLVSYAPNKLVYKSSTSAEQLAVFSEIYYPKGWNAYIDGVESPIFRANYILRALMVPAGSHEIVFEFKPKSFELGNKISFASSILMLLAVAGVIFIEFKKRGKSKKNEK